MPGRGLMEMWKKEIDSEPIGEYISVISTVNGISFFVLLYITSDH